MNRLRPSSTGRSGHPEPGLLALGAASLALVAALPSAAWPSTSAWSWGVPLYLRSILWLGLALACGACLDSRRAGLKRQGWLWWPAAMLMGGAAAWSMNMLARYSGAALPSMAQSMQGLPAQELGLLLFAGAFLAPLAEELLFRDAFFRAARHRMGSTTAILLSSALFALFHWGTWNMLQAGLAGLALGLMRVKAESVWPCIVAHGSYNLLLFQAWLQCGGPGA